MLEAYFPGQPIYGHFTAWNRTTLHNLHSVTKSFTSALVGLAMEQANFGLDSPLLDLFPEYDDIPRDMMKFGLLFLKDGKWQGKQLISAEWVRESTTQHGPRADYAYHWWLTNYATQGQTIEAFYAGGRGGQYIVVLRELDMVVVFTAGNDNDLAWRQPRDMMLRYLLPAVL